MKKVLGLGNVLVDVMTTLENDNLLSEFALPKGSMQHVDLEKSNQILASTSNLQKEQAAGGSAANTINGLANLGVQTAFIGKTGKDELGEFFSKDLVKNKIKPLLHQSETTGTGRVVALVSKDSERTFATYLGASIELTGDDLIEDHFKGYDYFHIEGYSVQDHGLIRRAVEIAKKQKMIISIDLASYNVVEDNLDFLHQILEEYIDIVFANEEEAKAFTKCEPEEALDVLSGLCRIAVVKMGKNGSLVKKGKDVYAIKAINATPIDTTGAGDLYASGFIYGLLKQYDLEKCGNIAAIAAGNVIEVVGPKMNEQRWEKIRKEIADLEA